MNFPPSKDDQKQSPIDGTSIPIPIDSPRSSPPPFSQEDTCITGTGRSRPIVWLHFKKVLVDGKEKAECNYCHQQLVSHSKNGTSHLHDHHRICTRRKNQDISQMMLTEYPLSMVDDMRFRKFCNTISLSFNVVSRRTIRGDIMKIYEVENEKSIKMLRKNRSRVAITTDLWIASNHNKGYMTITAHFTMIIGSCIIEVLCF
ncbi:hypothetical protein Patl1_13598 [Pistacia atlantica]|uniref:Uncharacterized protein n=1 Tax=Pistacia atlantica TaxID=434234 RepID=A0ACC1AYM3_9ROSI|nr:hypothetical protein Patl1_13598 [Pistacia atlantica]